ncbi:MAG: hypothetical protein Q9223_005211 [Gallowayella weberi]
MPGAFQKRAKAHPNGNHEQDAPNHYDGPSDRPGSSSGQPRPGPSRGGPPSNVSQPAPPSNAPGQSGRSSSRPRSAAGPPSAGGRAQLRDPARDPPKKGGKKDDKKDEEKKLPRRVDWGGNLYSYYSNEPLMTRPGYGREGKNIKLRLNSHFLVDTPDARYFQYDVAIDDDKLKRGHIKAIWNSAQLNKQIPGGIREWIYDGSKLAWSKQNIEKEVHMDIDLDEEKGLDISKIADENRDVHNVFIRRSARIDLANIYAYLNGQIDFGSSVIDAINFLDHLIREYPSKQHINIRKSYFDRTTGQKEFISGGVEAMRGIYQSIRMAEGKRMVINIDVSHTCFWSKMEFHLIINQLSGHMNLDTMGYHWRDRKTGKTNNLFLTMNRLKRCNFFVSHRGRSEKEKARVWQVHEILPQTSEEFTFKPWNKETKKNDPPISILKYYQKKYNIILEYPELPVVRCTKKDVVFPMEACNMLPGQRYPYQLNELQTSMMLKFAVQYPEDRLKSIQAGTQMLNWANDPVMKHYGLRINPAPITTNARVLDPPTIQFDKSTFAPGTKGKWDLRNKKFLVPNKAPLRSWGVGILTDPTSYQKQGTPNVGQVHAFIQNFIQIYRGHGGIVETTTPLIHEPLSDPAKLVEALFFDVGNKYNQRPQILLFVLPNRAFENWLRIKKSCDCRYGIFSQCVLGGNVIKNTPQYHSNVLMKVNAKLGGATSRVVTKGPSGHFNRPTMIIGADVSHAGPTIQAPSYAAMTVSMDKYATRYAAGVQTNGHRVEMISSRNLRDCLIPLFREWVTTVSGGRWPEHVYYFRDGVSEGQYLNVLKYEVADIKEIFDEMIFVGPGQTRPEMKFTVVVAEKRHHIRFFPGKAGDENQNALPGTIVEHDVTAPFENDVYLCSHKALKGTARPTHYTMLMDEAGVPVDVFQKMLYEHCYQYIRSTTPVSLFPAVYYAHLASNRARAQEDIAESERRKRDVFNDPSKSTGQPEVKPLLPMITIGGLPWGMWYI